MNPKIKIEDFGLGFARKHSFDWFGPRPIWREISDFLDEIEDFEKKKLKFQKSKIFQPAERIFWKFSKKSKIFWKISEKFENEKPSKFTKSSILFNFGAEKPQIRLDFRPEPPAEAKKISDFGEAKKRQKTPKFLALAKKTTINL